MARLFSGLFDGGTAAEDDDVRDGYPFAALLRAIEALLDLL